MSKQGGPVCAFDAVDESRPHHYCRRYLVQNSILYFAGIILTNVTEYGHRVSDCWLVHFVGFLLHSEF